MPDARRACAEGTRDLLQPKVAGTVSVEEAIAKRRSVRSFTGEALSASDLSQLLWSCQGITEPKRGLRSAPSAGAAYPLTIFAVYEAGVFKYEPEGHKLSETSKGDKRADLAQACMGQGSVAQAGLDIVICARYQAVTDRYGERGVRFTDFEVGHAAENVALQAVALGLSSVPIGAFSKDAVASIVGARDGLEPVYIVAVGKKR